MQTASVGISVHRRVYLDQGVHALQYPLHFILFVCSELF